MAVIPGAEAFRHDAGSTGVLLCHGFTGSPQTMRPLAEGLAHAGHTVRLPLLPGHGTTWQDLNGTSWRDWYAVVEQELTQLRGSCERVVVVGLSMGGALAARLAEEHGPRVAGVVLINPAFRVDDPRLYILPILSRFIPSVPGIGNDVKKVGGEDELSYDRTPLKALLSQTQLWKQTVEDLGELTQPVLLLRSVEDHVVPATSWQLFLKKVGSRDIRQVVLHDSYHVATLDNDAPIVLAETLSFIDTLVARG